MSKEKKKQTIDEILKALDGAMDDRSSSNRNRKNSIKNKKEQTQQEEQENKFRKAMQQFDFINVDDEEEE